MMLMRVCRVLSCHQTEYEISGECCPMCPPGSRVQRHCTEFRSTSCMPCTEGTYNEKSNGLQYCTPCSLCDSGTGLTVKLGCTLTSDSVCEPLYGFFCVDSSSKSCSAAQKHSSCEKGQYISQRGTASTDTECSDCSSGTFSDGTGTSSENLQLMEAGTSSTDAQCGERQDVSAVVIGVLVPAVLLTPRYLNSSTRGRDTPPTERWTATFLLSRTMASDLAVLTLIPAASRSARPQTAPMLGTGQHHLQKAERISCGPQTRPLSAPGCP
uniref:Si:dkey-23c22.5 n=1 Tax=Oryzias latipes TaxID=8090 RepID=A0A3P9I0V7_ORYLA